jgi:hypothetical protein
MGHVLAPEPTTEAGVVQSQQTCDTTRSLLISKAGSGDEGHVAALDPSWMARGVQSLWARGSVGALLG